MAKRKGRYRRGRRQRKAWSIQKKLGVIFTSVLAVLLITGVGYAASKVAKIDRRNISTDAKELNISEEVEHETGYLNVALFGLDSRDGSLGEGNRSDAIIIASLNRETGEIKMVSVYRDTLLEMNDGTYNKANAAYALGGPEEAIAMLNKNLDMNIEKYITVNFNALVEVIDALGGMTINMTDAEVIHTNNYCVETSEVTGKDYTELELGTEGGGDYHLNGVQAVSYSRIRYTAGGDFKRAERQRLVLEKIAEAAKQANLSQLNKIIDAVFPQVSTNFTLTEMIDYAKDIAKYKVGESQGFPSENVYDNINQVGSVVVANTLTENVKQVHQFLFGDDGYQVSSVVQGIEDNLDAGVGDSVSDDYYDDGADDYGSNYYQNQTNDTGDSSYNDDALPEESYQEPEAAPEEDVPQGGQTEDNTAPAE